MSYWTGRGKRVIAAGRLQVPVVIENRYALRLRAIMDALYKEYVRTLSLREDSYNRRTNTLDELGVRVVVAVRRAVAPAFDEMAEGVKRANKRALVAIQPTDARLAGEIAKFRDQNIQLVENAARSYSKQVRDIFDKPENFGVSWEDLRDELVERTGVAKSRAELIARDQTLKLNGQINMTRQTNAGIDQYTWSTSHDDRVRESHQDLDGQVFSWNSPPEVGHPGQDFQCRCVAIAILPSLEEE